MKKINLRPGMKVMALKDMDWVKKGMIGEYIKDYGGISDFALIKWKDARGQGHSLGSACWNVPCKNIKVLMSSFKRVI